MRLDVPLKTLYAIVVGLTIGCSPAKTAGESSPDGAGPGPRSGERPKAVAMEELGTAKAKLAKLEEAVKAKSQEVAALQAEAATLRSLIVVGESSRDKVYRSPLELLADMPKDVTPKPGPEGGIERAAAQEWLRANLLGRIVEWKANVSEVTIQGDGPFTILVGIDKPFTFSLPSNEQGIAFGDGVVQVGGRPCQVLLQWEGNMNGGMAVGGRIKAGVEYRQCSVPEAESLRRLKGKEVTFRAKLTARVWYTNTVYPRLLEAQIHSTGVNAVNDGFVIACQTTRPSVDGMLPEGSRPKN